MYKQRSLLDVLTEYVKKNLKKGYTIDSLRVALISQHYSKMEIEKAIKRAQLELASEAPVLKTKPEIEHKIIPYDQPKPKKGFFSRLFGK